MVLKLHLRVLSYMDPLRCKAFSIEVVQNHSIILLKLILHCMLPNKNLNKNIKKKGKNKILDGSKLLPI